MIGSRNTVRFRAEFVRRYLVALVTMLALFVAGAQAADDRTIRVGVLQYGTVAWTLNTLTHSGFDKAGNFKLEIVPLAANNAVQIALQGGKVDIIASDWLWVSRNRDEGRKLLFVPHSTALGGLYVRPDSGIKTLADLKGREFGVAGTPVDKSWLLLQVYARKHAGLDLRKEAKPSFAAPPALNEFILRGKLPAVQNFWNYAVRLKAAGMTQLLDMNTVLAGLGVKKPVPMFGWVFSEQWEAQHKVLLADFLAAADKTYEVLRSDDAEWRRLRPLMKAETDAELAALRDTYRKGIVADELKVNLRTMQDLYEVLAAEGGEELVGKAKALDPATFYPVPGSRP